MFRRSYNRALLRVRITTVTPLLIRAGDTGLSPTVADLSCVRTDHGVMGETVYVPGSSLKGVMRQAAEASVRDQTFREKGAVRGACDPLHDRDSCSAKIKHRLKEMSSAQIYASLCLACRTFGSLAVKGRASVRDLFPWDDSSSAALAETAANRARGNDVEVRHNVAINRITGSVRHGPFDQEVVPPGVSFWGEIALENYQLWQLGFIAQALEELDSGFVCIGSSTTRGMGQVRASLDQLVHEQPEGRSTRPAGVGAFATEKEVADYQLFPEEALAAPGARSQRSGLWDRFVVSEAADIAVWRDQTLSALRALK